MLRGKQRNILIIIVVFSVFLIALSRAWASDFCEGWEEGYKAGYCYQNSLCLSPLVPLCPLPRLGEKTYQDGYNRGFFAGLNAKR